MAAAQAFVLAALTLSHLVTPGVIIALSFVLGLVNAFDMPGRQAFVIQMIEDPADLGNAIALNSLLVNGARLVGPALAGVLIAELGEGVCFALNGASYLAVIIALLAMRIVKRSSARVSQTVLKDLREGFAYAFGFPPIRDVLGALALSSLMGMSFVTVMPVFAGEVLGGSSRTLGLLLGATGLGAVSAGTVLAARRTVRGLGRVIAAGAAVFGAALCAEGFVHTVTPAVLVMAVVGLGMMLQIASSNTILQTLVDDDKRGRVMSLYAMAFLGMTPFGSLIAGALAETIGVQPALRISGLCCLIGGIIFALRLPVLRRLSRPIYVRKGIIPGVEG